MTSSPLCAHMRSVQLMEEETENFWNRNCNYFLIQNLPGMFYKQDILNLKLFLFLQVILYIWCANTCLMKKKKKPTRYQPRRCTLLSHKCPNKQDWRSQIRSKSWAINACVDNTASENKPAEARALQRHIFLLHWRTLLMIRVLWSYRD